MLGMVKHGIAAACLAVSVAGEAMAAPGDIYMNVAGGAGGDAFEVRCRPGFYFIGVLGRAGAIIDRFRLRCQSIANGWAGNSYYTTWMGDSRGGAEAVGYDCEYVSRPAAVNRIRFNAVNPGIGLVVNKIHIFCVFTYDGTPRGNYILGENDGPHNHADQQCPPGYMGVGLWGRKALYVDAMGLICGPIQP